MAEFCKWQPIQDGFGCLGFYGVFNFPSVYLSSTLIRNVLTVLIPKAKCFISNGLIFKVAK